MILKGLQKAYNPIFRSSLINVNQRGFAAKRKDYYDILGISKNATIEQIKDAYRNKAKLYHPDVNTTGETYQPNDDRFKDVAEAYAVLSVQESRIQYDTMGERQPENIFAAQKN
jgi:curved DNA-binding protein CbpA